MMLIGGLKRLNINEWNKIKCKQTNSEIYYTLRAEPSSMFTYSDIPLPPRIQTPRIQTIS